MLLHISLRHYFSHFRFHMQLYMTKLINIIQSQLGNSQHCLENLSNTLLKCWILLPHGKFHLKDTQSLVLSNPT